MTNVDAIASKTTTQDALLEKFLTRWRIRKVLPFINSQDCVLDFGCGRHLQALRAIDQRASLRVGIDSCFKGQSANTDTSGIVAFGDFLNLKEYLDSKKTKIDTIISLACFEHLTEDEFTAVLGELYDLSARTAKIVGTVPTPLAKPVLEFLSYKLNLIDPSQILDHKIYYDRERLTMALKASNWKLTAYKTFQLGMNSFFVFEKD